MKTLVGICTFLLIALGAVSQEKKVSKTKNVEVTLEEVAEKCKGLPRDKRVTVKVARFSVSAKSSQAHATFGDELATMLTSALQQTSCFRVLETNKNLSDATGEMAFAQDGFTNGSGPQAGQMLGAQLVVTGEITDFTQGQSSTTILGVSSGSNQATVGFTLKVLNPQTGEVLFSKDINMKGKTSGFTGLSTFGVKVAGSTENRAVQDATQKAIIKSVEVLVDAKDEMEIPEPMKPREIKKYSPQNCTMLRSGSPKMIILVTEAVGAGTARDNSTVDLDRREREIALKQREANVGLARDLIGLLGSKKKEPTKPEETASRQTSASAVYKPVVIEQSATETELTRHFIEAGFRVVDPKVYGKMRQMADSTGDLGQMAALGLKMGAQMIVTGQAVTERTNSQGGMVSARARLEIRVISTEDGSILATNTISGGGIDVSEAIANKVAIQTAAFNMSQYLMERLCAMNITFASTNASVGGGGGGVTGRVSGGSPAATANMTTIAASNANFTKLKALGDALRKNTKVKDVKSTLKDGSGSLTIQHTGSTDDLVDYMTKLTAPKFEVTGMEDGQITISMQ
ncbi:MAG: CsgG/HfaB family protein [Runella sp.]